MPEPDVLGRNGTYVGLRKYQSRVGAFNRFLRENGQTDEDRELLAAKLVGRWRSGAPLTLAPAKDDPALGEDPQRNNDFTYANDPQGRQVPLGCHMRRMNPRDTKMPVLTIPRAFSLDRARQARVCRRHWRIHVRLHVRCPGRSRQRRTTRTARPLQ